MNIIYMIFSYWVILVQILIWSVSYFAEATHMYAGRTYLLRAPASSPLFLTCNWICAIFVCQDDFEHSVCTCCGFIISYMRTRPNPHKCAYCHVPVAVLIVRSTLSNVNVGEVGVEEVGM